MNQATVKVATMASATGCVANCPTRMLSLRTTRITRRTPIFQLPKNTGAKSSSTMMRAAPSQNHGTGNYVNIIRIGRSIRCLDAPIINLGADCQPAASFGVKGQ
jgi:hypothetical protein